MSEPLELELAELRAELERVRSVLPERISLEPENVERGLAGLVLAIVELLRQVLEREAVRRMDRGTLTDEEIERVGLSLLRLERTVREIASRFGLSEDEIQLKVGVA